MIARLLKESQESQNLIFYASPLHDIGKLGIPDSILLKPGKLTDYEFEVIKTHCEIAVSILQLTKSPYLQAGATIALTHHERFDGKGYPNYLKGEEIPLFGRIVGLVDVFDAVTSKRPYKDPWPLDKAFDLLESGKGTQFDATIVDLFLNNTDEVRTIFNDHKEES
jgi:putative two-component system response regulator